MNKVLVLQPSIRPKDLSSAMRYGRIDYVFSDPAFQPSLEPGTAIRDIDESLKNFRPEEDFVLFLGGDPVGAIMLGHRLATRFPGTNIRTLRWERERDTNGRPTPGAGFYVPAMIRG